MKEIELGRLEYLAQQASPAPWTFGRIGKRVDDIKCATPVEDPDSDFPASRAIVVTDSGHYPPLVPDAEFICAARTAVPELCAYIRKLQSADANELAALALEALIDPEALSDHPQDTYDRRNLNKHLQETADRLRRPR